MNSGSDKQLNGHEDPHNHVNPLQQGQVYNIDNYHVPSELDDWSPIKNGETIETMSGVYTKGDNNNEYGIIVEVDEESHHNPVGRSNMKVSKGVQKAALMDTFFGGLNSKSARSMIKKHGDSLGFTFEDYKEMRNRYDSVLGKLTQIVKKKSPSGFPHRYTSVPGQIIHVDPKQCGGSKGPSQESVLHGVCQVTGYQIAVEMTGDDDNAWIDATRRLVKRFRIYGLKSKIDGAGIVKEIWFDKDPKVQNIKSYWLTRGVHVSQSAPNHYNPKVEACIQQIENRVARIIVSYPVEVPDWLARQFWIAQTAIHNMITQPDKYKSPYEKYTDEKPMLEKLSLAPVGQLVVIRREDNERKRRVRTYSNQHDSMIGKSRGKLAILLGPCSENLHARWVMPLIGNMNSVNVSLITFATDMRYLPMDPTLFPKSFIKRQDNFGCRHMNQGFWMLWMHERELNRSGYLSTDEPEREVENSHESEKIYLVVDSHGQEIEEDIQEEEQEALEREKYELMLSKDNEIGIIKVASKVSHIGESM